MRARGTFSFCEHHDHDAVCDAAGPLRSCDNSKRTAAARASTDQPEIVH